LSRPRRAAWIAILTALLVSPALVSAQTARPTARVGVVRNQPATDPMHQAFIGALRERGWVEGRNLVIDYLEGDLPKFPELVRELVRRNVDVILAPNPQQARIARDATSTIPIVFVVVGDPVGTGLVKSLAKPGGNVTGLTGFGSDLGGKRLEILKELVPRLARVAVLMNPTVPDKVLEWEHMQAAARELKVDVISVEVRSPDDLRAAFQAIGRAKPNGLIALAEPLLFANRQAVIDFARDARLPAMFAWRQAVGSGALVSYGPDIVDLYRRAAGYVDRILRGVRPADLPVEQPTRFEFAVNLKTARALGLTVPSSIMLRADQVDE